MADAATFSLPRAVICEGPDDVVFVRQLLSARSIPPFHIMHTGMTRSDRGGQSKFGDKLEAISANRSFRVLRDIVLVSDNDDDPAGSFASIAEQISRAGFEAPTRPVDRAGNRPSISVYMVPHGQSGNLECYCQDAARSVSTVNSEVDQFVALIRAERWNLPNRGKLWLRATLSAQWERDPFIHLGELLDRQGAKDLIPLDHSSFNGLVSHLSDVASNPR